MSSPLHIDPHALPSIRLGIWRDLPDSPGVYFAIGPEGEILYIGETINLRARMSGHHRLDQFHAAGCTRLAYYVAEEAQRGRLESAWIARFRPRLNGTPLSTSGREVLWLSDHISMHLTELARAWHCAPSEGVQYALAQMQPEHPPQGTAHVLKRRPAP